VIRHNPTQLINTRNEYSTSTKDGSDDMLFEEMAVMLEAKPILRLDAMGAYRAAIANVRVKACLRAFCGSHIGEKQ
jgi:hypothetical protein